MRLPRVRFTVRRMMIAVAVVAGCLWGRSFAIEQYRYLQIYRQLRGQPVALDLWHGRVVQGDDVERLIGRHSPHHMFRRGPYVDLHYYPGGPPSPGDLPNAGTTLMAKDGRLILAGSAGCTFEHVYFDATSPGDIAEFYRLLHLTPGKHPELGDKP